MLDKHVAVNSHFVACKSRIPDHTVISLRDPTQQNLPREERRREQKTDIMNVVLGHDFALQSDTVPGRTLANEMNCGMKHAPGAGSNI